MSLLTQTWALIPCTIIDVYFDIFAPSSLPCRDYAEKDILWNKWIWSENFLDYNICTIDQF